MRKKVEVFYLLFYFFVFHAVDYCCNVWILDLRSHKYFTSDFFFSDIEYLSLTYQPNLICFNFNSAVIVESIKSVWTAHPQYVTGNLGWGVMLEKCQTWPIVTKVWNRTISFTCSYLFDRGRKEYKIFNRTKLCIFFGGTWLYHPGAFMFAITMLRWLKALVCLFFFWVRILVSLALKVVPGQYRT